MATEYLFIDGGSLRAWYTEVMRDFYGSADLNDIDFNSLRGDCGAQKVFYYDCLDDVDPDYLGIEIRASNSRYAGSAWIYASLSDLSDFADRIV